MSIYEGDPKIEITEEGAEINFPGNGGQPEMDRGVENLAILSLFTNEGWHGNSYFREKEKKIGSSYVANTQRPITLSSLELIRKATISALDDPAFKDVKSTVSVSSGTKIDNLIEIGPPGVTKTEILINKNGQNWVYQSQKGE